MSAAPCACEPPDATLDPFLIVIFGASGDLTARKLMPSLYSLFVRGRLPASFAVLGAARTPLDTAAFRERMEAAVRAAGETDMGQWPAFGERLAYCRLEYGNAAAYTALEREMRGVEQRFATGGNRLFYLATPPAVHGPVAQGLGAAGLSREGAGISGWRRLVVEKPFGHDLASAGALDRDIKQGFCEEQVYRIDHYLAKDTVQNVLMLRFANTIFEPLWNRGFIDYVGIVAAESIGVGHRAGYYDRSGVLRDMFQNHMMQLLALTAMEPPPHFGSEQVEDEKIKVFRALRPLGGRHVHDHVVLGRYTAAGSLAGYRDEPGVAPDSRTPTFAALRLFIDNWRWQGVPFYLVSGKRLPSKETRIVIQFKAVPHSLFHGILSAPVAANRLQIGIYPEEKITLGFSAKGRGTALCLTPVDMEYRYPGLAAPVDAYEKVLMDCLTGDRMLFWSQRGLELSWSFFEPILRECDSGPDCVLVQPYAAGTPGPAAAWEWLPSIVPEWFRKQP